MVFGAVSSWADMLDLPFAEKIFLDDRSPDLGALQLLRSTQLLDKFTRAEYCTTSHPAHCNFGYVGSVQLATTPYIFHLDDDVYVNGSAEECRQAIDLAIHVMEEHPTIMGFSLLSLDPSFQGAEWLPDEIISEQPRVSHPKKYFGNAASVIRRELLERVDFAQLMTWGDNQPGGWEIMVSNSPKEFAIGELNTPFHVKRTSYFFSSTNDISTRVRLTYMARTQLRKLFAKNRATVETK